ncbi:MAG: lipopolysaccharide heptosyltransferase II [Candidatus Omnitrophota bacterium]
MSGLSRKRILIVNPFGIGDVLFTTPLLRSLKENISGSFIGYVCNARTEKILASNPFVDRIFVFEKDYFRSLAKKSRLKCLKEFLKLLSSIKQERFDLCLDLSLSGQIGFFVWLLGIKERVGFNYKNRGWLLTKGLSFAGYEGKHVVEFYLDLLRKLDIPVSDNQLEIFLSDEEKKRRDDFFKKMGIGAGDRVIAVIPGAGLSWGKDAVVKHWPAENFADIADKCIEKFSSQIIIMGDFKDENACRAVQEKMSGAAVQLCGKTTLRQFAAILNRCSLVITNDGGPLHMAVACGAKTVSLFGPVDEKVYGPYPFEPQRHRVIKKQLDCRPCYRRFKLKECPRRLCLETINPEEVFGAIEELLCQ